MKETENSAKNKSACDKKSKKSSPRGALAITQKVLFGILLLFCAFVLVVTSWLAIDKFILRSKVPSFAGYAIMVVETGSMENTIMEGDLILIKKTGDYKIGDIITFAHEDEEIPTTHRIINFSHDGTDMFVTRGDANNTKDRENVSQDEIFGEVVLIMHGLGLFVGWLTEGGGFIYLVAAALIVILGVFLIKDENNRVLKLEKEPEPETGDGNTDAEPEDASADEAEEQTPTAQGDDDKE